MLLSNCKVQDSSWKFCMKWRWSLDGFNEPGGVILDRPLGPTVDASSPSEVQGWFIVVLV